MHRESRKKKVLCPTHQIPMRRLGIAWGLIAAPLPEEKDKEVIYGGCCMPVYEDGKTPEYGFVCPECVRISDKEQTERPFYFLIDGVLVKQFDQREVYGYRKRHCF